MELAAIQDQIRQNEDRLQAFELQKQEETKKVYNAQRAIGLNWEGHVDIDEDADDIEVLNTVVPPAMLAEMQGEDQVDLLQRLQNLSADDILNFTQKMHESLNDAAVEYLGDVAEVIEIADSPPEEAPQVKFAEQPSSPEEQPADLDDEPQSRPPQALIYQGGWYCTFQYIVQCIEKGWSDAVGSSQNA